MDDQISRSSGDSVRKILLSLAKRHDDLAADLAAATPYWTPCPPDVLGHRTAATALRESAELLAMPGAVIPR